MYLRILGAACALSLGCAALAQAADPHVIVYGDGTPATLHRVAVAAKALCAKAMAQDPEEYVSYDDCVTDAISGAHTLVRNSQTIADAK